MDASQLKLGETWWRDEKRERDAVHIAVAPVVAGETLAPGTRVAFADSGKERVVKAKDYPDDAVGIIDPYLRAPVSEKTRCWLFLFPGTVTGLRHQWNHPAFADVTPAEAAKAWVTEFAMNDLGLSYDRLMSAAERREDDDWEYDNTERYKDVDEAKWPVFWAHYQTITGRKGDPDGGAPFTCSC